MSPTHSPLFWLLVCAFTLTGFTASEGVPPELTRLMGSLSPSRMEADVARLSGPEFNGRQTGTADDLKSAAFVVERFQQVGLRPEGGQALPGASADRTWVLTDQVGTSEVLAPAELEVVSGSTRQTATPGQDFLPILDSPSVDVTAPLVFVGYGISDPSGGLDDYAGVDVRNRVVLFLRGKPEGYGRPVTHTDKERMAREKGALAFLTATGPILSAYESRRGVAEAPMALYSQPKDGSPLPGAWISTTVAEKILADEGRPLPDLQRDLNKAKPAQSFTAQASIRLHWKTRQASGRLYNVVGMLPGQTGSDPQTVLVIGAHRDHFGRQAGLLFPGADDNASGTAVLLEVARVLSQSGVKPKRAILFLSFSGEEQGLLGSRLYVNRPSLPLGRTSAMLNVDHAGIGNGRLTVGLTGLSKELAAEAGTWSGLADRLDLYGFFPGGDHVPFKEAGIPTATIVSAGPHPHFHQPSDEAGTVKPEILEATARYLLALAWRLAEIL